jgi:hypothetical protein
LVIPLRSHLFFQFRSQLVHKIQWPSKKNPIVSNNKPAYGEPFSPTFFDQNPTESPHTNEILPETNVLFNQ